MMLPHDNVSSCGQGTGSTSVAQHASCRAAMFILDSDLAVIHAVSSPTSAFAEASLHAHGGSRQLPSEWSEFCAVHKTGVLPARKRVVDAEGRTTTCALDAVCLNNQRLFVLSVTETAPQPNLSEDLARLNRLASLGTLSSMAAHEIKNALVAVKTFVDLLGESNTNTDLSGVVRKEIGRMEDLLGGMLHMARAPQTHFEPVNLCEVMEYACKLTQPQARTRQTTIQNDTSAEAAFVSGQRGDLLQVMVNLLMNAIEAAPAGAVIRARVSFEAGAQSEKGAAGMVELCVDDNGPGLPEAARKRLFEPFFSTKSQGTGLGLAISRKLVEQHGGTISLDERTEGGTSARVRIPAI